MVHMLREQRNGCANGGGKKILSPLMRKGKEHVSTGYSLNEKVELKISRNVTGWIVIGFSIYFIC